MADANQRQTLAAGIRAARRVEKRAHRARKKNPKAAALEGAARRVRRRAERSVVRGFMQGR